jgi:hypothetical protein
MEERQQKDKKKLHMKEIHNLYSSIYIVMYTRGMGSGYVIKN